jgi:hypothetical protein
MSKTQKPMAQSWASKQVWHARQRALPLRTKIERVIVLQERQQAINNTKAAIGLPTSPMRVWKTRP